MKSRAGSCRRADLSAIIDQVFLAMRFHRLTIQIACLDELTDARRVAPRTPAERRQRRLDAADVALHAQVDEPSLPLLPRLFLARLADHGTRHLLRGI